MTPATCPYCGASVRLAPATVIYGPAGKPWGSVYHCARFPACDSYVGVHRGTTTAKGSLANAELRSMRMRAHEAFDQSWRGRKLSRSSAYIRLSEQMGLPADATHIGQFTLEQCTQVIALYGGPAADFTPVSNKALP